MTPEKKLSKAETKKLAKRVCMDKKGIWVRCQQPEKKEIFKYAAHYADFISLCKTERECVEFISREAASRRFTSPDSSDSEKLSWTFRGKSAALAVKGSRPVVDGVRIVAAHIDAPRLDLKPNPLYEELEMAFCKTHYYGGIKKFHWLCRPLAIHGLFFKADGSKQSIVIGEEHDDPVFTINDILPHLAGKVQAVKKLREAIPAEKLNILVGGIPINAPEDTSEMVKLAILHLLDKEYGMVEQDFVSAEIEIVPAGRARDVGLDRIFIGGYGHDDRSCAYAALKAIFGTSAPEYTAIALFLDKEETGSDGNTGAKSRFLEKILFDIMRNEGSVIEPDSLTSTLMNSMAISADVTAGMDPDYMEVHEKNNDALMGHGISLTKYTGSGGKYSANDANAEYVSLIRKIWNSAEVVWQAGEMGKVDEGGGGTIAKHLAAHGMEVVDAGPPLLSMHSPFEIVHKGDLYMTFKAFQAFFTYDDLVKKPSK